MFGVAARIRVVATVLLLTSITVASPVAAWDPGSRMKVAAQHFVDLEDEEAEALLEELSAEGRADADVMLGYLYSDPLYEERDDERALSYFKRAAEKDNAEGVFQLAEAVYWPGYLDPEPGVPAQILGWSNEDTYRLLKRAIELKHGGAVFRLALLCIFENYDCSEDDIEMSLNVRRTAFGSGTSLLSDPFPAFQILRDEKESFERIESYNNSLEVGLSFVNPLVATVWGGGVEAGDNCRSLSQPAQSKRGEPDVRENERR